MESASRVSLYWFVLWAAAVIFMASIAANSEVAAVAIQDDLIKEIENLDVINQLNAGQWDSRNIAIHADTDFKSAGEIQLRAEHSSQRSILSQR